MPLPNLRNQCSAKSKRSKQRCKNPCAFNCKVCRFHGARRSFPKGEQAPNYKHGKATLEARAEYRRKMQALRELEELSFKYGIISGTRTVGRKLKLNC